MRITFLLGAAYGMGGTIRDALTLANQLAEHHDIEIVTVWRRQSDPFFRIDERITVRTLMDLRKGVRPGRLDAMLGRRGSRLVARSDKMWSQITMRGDYRLWRALRTLDTDVLITTCPAFNLLAARFAPRDLILVGLEHLHPGAHRDDLRERLRRRYPRLDALVTLTEADQRAYAEFLHDAPVQLAAIPSPLSPGPKPLSRLNAPVIVAAGRLTKVKHYEHLIAAFAKATTAHPGWVLRLYGTGPEGGRLRATAADHDLGNRVEFKGCIRDIHTAFAGASAVALSSSCEGFGTTIIEAFACGVPVASFDCPHGPREIITHRRNGILVPQGDVDALADALADLITNPAKRHAMGAAARATATYYDAASIAQRWETLLTDLQALRRRPDRDRRHRRSR